MAVEAAGDIKAFVPGLPTCRCTSGEGLRVERPSGPGFHGRGGESAGVRSGPTVCSRTVRFPVFQPWGLGVQTQLKMKRRNGDMALNLGEGDLRVALAVRKMPLASAGDIAAVQRRTDSGVHTRLRAMSDEEPGR